MAWRKKPLPRTSHGTVNYPRATKEAAQDKTNKTETIGAQQNLPDHKINTKGVAHPGKTKTNNAKKAQPPDKDTTTVKRKVKE